MSSLSEKSPALPSSIDNLDIPAKFSAGRLVRVKSLPTTHVTTGELDWDLAFQSQAGAGVQTNGKGLSSNSNPRESSSRSHIGPSGDATRSHGLLTPHASVSEKIVEQDYYSAQSNIPSTPSTQDGSLSEIRFATPGNSSTFDELDLPITPRARTFGSTSSSENASHVSVGVQTSLPYSSSYASTTPTSPTGSVYVTPRASPKRKRKDVPEYVREGDRLARELEEELTYIAQEKRNLRQSLAHIERKEQELQSLLIPSSQLSDDAAKIDTKDSTSETDSESARHVRFRGRVPLTPASSDLEIRRRAKGKATKTPIIISPTMTASSEHSSTSNSTYISTTSHQSEASTIRDSKNGTVRSDSALRVPSYTFAEGSSSSSSLVSLSDFRGEHAQTLDLGPNPICDPSTYLVWFDLETTDAVRPAANIRILEVAVLITDRNYRRLDKGKSFIVHWPLTAEEIANEMSQKVREMHEKSGLLAAYASTPPKERLTLQQVERRICKYLARHDIERNGRAVMAGAGVAFDRGMVRQHMEKLNAYFSHQIFDTTTLWHFIRRKYSRTRRFSETCVHRALDDIMESSREAKLYSELILRPGIEVHWPTQSSQGI